MLTTTYAGRAVREPRATTIHDLEAAEVHWCACGCGQDVSNEGDYASDECADSAAHDAAEDARADLEEDP
jgi:hypothetical protein